MSKIVQAVNAMIIKKHKISSVTQGLASNELFFLYDQKYKWSLLHGGELEFDSGEQEDYVLFYYRTDLTIERLVTVDVESMPQVKLARYSANEIGTKEALGSFRELYLVLKEKLLGIDEVLDDIIEEEPL